MSEQLVFWPEWQLDDQIGFGGWSRVYRASRRDHPDIQAAVKVLNIPSAETEEVLREILRMKDLEGTSHVVSIEDYSIQAAPWGRCTVYIRMELLRPLRSYLSDKSLSEAEVLRMGIDLCRGLEMCHRHSILHGDIKPDNILVKDTSSGPLYKLGDFGIAGVLGRPGDEEENGELFGFPEDVSCFPKGAADLPEGTPDFPEDVSLQAKGTPEYMAPELREGRQDARSDLYSLGLTLYRCLNGDRMPFLSPRVRVPGHEERMSALRLRLSGAPLPPIPGASERTMAVLWRVCAYQPEDRYPDAAALREALEEALSAPEKEALSAPEKEAPAQGKASPASEKAGAGPGKHRRLILSLLGAAALLLITGVLLWQAGRRSTTGSAGPEPTAVPLQPATIVTRDQVARPDAIRAGLNRLREYWAVSSRESLPASLPELPFVLEAAQYTPMASIQLSGDDGLRVTLQEDSASWGVMLQIGEEHFTGCRYLAEEDCWCCSADPGWEEGWIVLSQEAGSVSVEYHIGCASGELEHLVVFIRQNEKYKSIQLDWDRAESFGAPWWVCMQTPEGRNLTGLYDRDGQPLAGCNEKLEALEARIPEFTAFWQDSLYPLLLEGKYYIPCSWTQLPFTLYPDEAPEIRVEEEENQVRVRLEDSLPEGWCVRLGQGLPVEMWDCVWNQEEGCWIGEGPFEAVYLLRTNSEDAISITLQYNKETEYMAEYPVLEFGREDESGAVGYNCYGWGTARNYLGSMYAIALNDTAFYAEYGTDHRLLSYSDLVLGLVYDDGDQLTEGTEPEGYVNPVVHTLP